MSNQALGVALVVSIVLASLWGSNILYDRGVPQYLSRKLGHAGGGTAFLLLPLFFSTPWWPLTLSVGFLVLLLAARLFRPASFRGVGGTGRPHATEGLPSVSR